MNLVQKNPIVQLVKELIEVLQLLLVNVILVTMMMEVTKIAQSVIMFANLVKELILHVQYVPMKLEIWIMPVLVRQDISVQLM